MSDSSTSQPILVSAGPLDRRFDPFRFLKWGGMLLGVLTLLATLIYWSMGKYYHRPDWTLMNCLFMVVITLTTIGYGDWLELKNLYAAEAFTMLLAMIGIAVPAFVISNFTALIVEGLFTERFRRRRMEKLIAGLKDHIIVCGVGTTGTHCLSELMWTGRSVVGIDKDEIKLRHLCDEIGEFLRRRLGRVRRGAQSAGIEGASGLIACLTEDKGQRLCHADRALDESPPAHHQQGPRRDQPSQDDHRWRQQHRKPHRRRWSAPGL